MTDEREERTKWLEIWIPPGWTDDARIQFWDGEDWGHECHFDSLDLQSIPRHTDAEYEELAKKHDRLLADWWKLTSKYDELKAKLDSRERRIKELCLWGQQGEKERIELRAELEQTKAKLIRLERFVRDQYLLPDLEVALGIAKDREKKEV